MVGMKCATRPPLRIQSAHEHAGLDFHGSARYLSKRYGTRRERGGTLSIIVLSPVQTALLLPSIAVVVPSAPVRFHSR